MKKLLLPGASGFVGKNIIPILKKDYKISSLGRAETNDIVSNLAEGTLNLTDYTFDVVIHAAGMAHVAPNTEDEKKAFFDVNYQGTINLCTALEQSHIPKSFIFVSTVAVYGREAGELIDEEHALEGETPYALSKIKAEEYLIDWCEKHNVVLSIIRPSLIAGPNPPGNLGAMINGIKTGKYLSIAGGKAQKSVLMVEDIAHLVPLLEKKGGIYNICDDTHPSFGQLEKLISQQLNKKSPLTIPYWLAKSMALVGNLLGDKAPINSDKLRKITETLTFSNEKAKRELNWKPSEVLESFRIGCMGK